MGGLLEKILNVPIPQPRRRSMPQPDGAELEEDSFDDYEGRRSPVRGRQGAPGKNKKSSSTRRKLPRVESSPAELGRWYLAIALHASGEQYPPRDCGSFA